jgi:hypothetical protein
MSKKETMCLHEEPPPYLLAPLTCTLPTGHSGPHKAVAPDGEELGIWKNENEKVDRFSELTDEEVSMLLLGLRMLNRDWKESYGRLEVLMIELEKELKEKVMGAESEVETR